MNACWVPPPPFTSGSWLTQECLNDLNLNCSNFLWLKELKLVQHILKLNEKALAWTDAEHEGFHEDYFLLVKIPTVAHTPWVLKNIPIPTGIMDDVINIIKKKITAGIYEPSDAFYCSMWFCVKKKNSSLCIIYSLSQKVMSNMWQRTILFSNRVVLLEQLWGYFGQNQYIDST